MYNTTYNTNTLISVFKFNFYKREKNKTFKINQVRLDI